MFYYGRAHYRVSYKYFYRYEIHFLGIGTTIVQLSLYSSGQGWKLQSYKPEDVFALFGLWYLANYLAYFFLISDEFFHFTCCSNDAKCIGNFVFHVLFPTGASKVNRLAREMIWFRGRWVGILRWYCWFWNVISFRYPLLVHERAYGSYYKSISAYINDDFLLISPRLLSQPFFVMSAWEIRNISRSFSSTFCLLQI